MKKYNVAILGATGLVGREMLKVLEARNFPINELHLFASRKNDARTLIFRGSPCQINGVDDESFDGIDIVLGAAPNAVAQKYADKIVKSGAIFIDNSSAFRLDKDVPLIVPSINPDDISKHKGIISNPNCLTIIVLTAIHPIYKLSRVKTIQITSFQAVSGVGQAGLDELLIQYESIMGDQDKDYPTFGHPIVNNVIPQISTILENGYTGEEVKVYNEGRKILHDDALKASCTCVRVPVERCHSAAVVLSLEHKVSLSEIEHSLIADTNIVFDGKSIPMPYSSIKGDMVYVGRVREDACVKNGIALWCCADQIQKGAATNAVQIAELCINR